jgi:hypothetical protein
MLLNILDKIFKMESANCIQFYSTVLSAPYSLALTLGQIPKE